jgi:hypothetical protein
MANPGPATTVANHPSNLATNQALRLIASAQSVNLSAAGDTAMSILNVSKFVPVSVLITNGLNSSGATTTIATATVGVYTGTGQTGSTVLTTAALTSNTGGPYVTTSPATNAATAISSPSTMYVNVGTTIAATCDVFVYGYDLTFLP